MNRFAEFIVVIEQNCNKINNPKKNVTEQG